MADEAAVMVEDVSPAQSPLVAISFQRNVRRKEKYLEGEPKALGITQIGLSVFQITCVAVFLSKGLNPDTTDIPFFISSLLVIIAGILAIAAQNLHLPTLRACLGMQIVASGASVFNMICSLVKMEDLHYMCYSYRYDSNSSDNTKICQSVTNTHTHFFAESMVIHVALVAISLTLAGYCCKVVNCCSPAPKMPVITVQAPPAQQ